MISPALALTLLIATFSFICHPPFWVEVEHYKIKTSRMPFLTATLKNGTLDCLDVMERPNETSEAAHCWTCNGLIFNVKLQRFRKGGWRLDGRKRESIQI